METCNLPIESPPNQTAEGSKKDKQSIQCVDADEFNGFTFEARQSILQGAGCLDEWGMDSMNISPPPEYERETKGLGGRYTTRSPVSPSDVDF